MIGNETHYMLIFTTIINIENIQVASLESRIIRNALTIKRDNSDPDTFRCKDEMNRNRWVEELRALQDQYQKKANASKMEQVLSQLESFMLAHDTCENILPSATVQSVPVLSSPTPSSIHSHYKYSKLQKYGVSTHVTDSQCSSSHLQPTLQAMLKLMSQQTFAVDLLHQAVVVPLKMCVAAIHDKSETTSPTVGRHSDEFASLITSDSTQEYLNSCSGIHSELQSIYQSLAAMMKSLVEGSEQATAIAELLYNSSSISLYKHFLQYASNQYAFGNTLQSGCMSEFRDEVSKSLEPSTFEKINEGIISFMQRTLTHVIHLREMQTVGTEYASWDNAVIIIQEYVTSIDQSLRTCRNSENMAEIRGSFATLEPLLEQILYSDRVFIREGDLLKLCRKKQKLFHFWLFNDYVLYGTQVKSMLSRSYHFHRALKLATCSIQIHVSQSLRYAFEIHSAEKSFIVIASSEEERGAWMHDLTNAIETLQKLNSNSQIASDRCLVAAPLWVNDKECNSCQVCLQVVLFLFRPILHIHLQYLRIRLLKF